jgi:two-component system LytT family response regulator
MDPLEPAFPGDSAAALPRPLRVAVVDDEPLARARLARLLEKLGCEVQGIFTSSRGLLQGLKEMGPLDGLFLDVQMPGLSGLELLECHPKLPPVVIVSAYTQYALQAFEKAVVDYLKKPVWEARLQKSVDRLKAKAVALSQLQAPAARRRFPVQTDEGTSFLELKHVTHFEVQQEMVWAWTGDARFRTAWTSLTQVEEQLSDASSLLRIQRHLLIRTESVMGLRRHLGGRLSVRVAEGVDLPVSRSVAPRLKALLGL